MLDPLSVCIDLQQQAAAPVANLPRRRLLRSCGNDDYIFETDYSNISTYLSCPKQYENAVVLGREGLYDTSATSFGDLFHRCEELRLRADPRDEPAWTTVYAKQHALVQEHFSTFRPAPTDHRTADRMIAVLAAYNQRYAGDCWPQLVLTIDDETLIERPFSYDLCTIAVNAVVPYSPETLVIDSDQHPECCLTIGPDSRPGLFIRNIHVRYTGKIDLALQENGGLWVVDHKTTSMGGEAFFNSFRTSLQTRGYTAAASRILNLPFLGCIVNAVVIRKPSKTGTPTEFIRQPYFYSPDSQDEAIEAMKTHTAGIVSMLTVGNFPQAATSFKSPCDWCDYNDNCSLPRDQRLADLQSPLFRDKTWNPAHE